MILELIRVGQSSRGTFGALRYGAVAFALTLERPWDDNKENVSCIPAGRYTCRRVRSPHFGITFKVLNVPGREDILFHRGNYLHDTKGCILVGEEFSGTFDKPFVASSERGYLEFMKLLEGHNEFTLIIHDAIPVAIEEQAA